MFASPKSWRYFDTQNHAPSTNCYKELPIPVGPLVPYFLSQTHVRNQTLPLASSVINPKPRTAFFSNVAVTLRSSWCYVSGLISILFPWPHGILRTVPSFGRLHPRPTMGSAWRRGTAAAWGRRSASASGDRGPPRKTRGAARSRAQRGDESRQANSRAPAVQMTRSIYTYIYYIYLYIYIYVYYILYIYIYVYIYIIYIYIYIIYIYYIYIYLFISGDCSWIYSVLLMGLETKLVYDGYGDPQERFRWSVRIGFYFPASFSGVFFLNISAVPRRWVYKPNMTLAEPQ